MDLRAAVGRHEAVRGVGGIPLIGCAVAGAPVNVGDAGSDGIGTAGVAGEAARPGRRGDRHQNQKNQGSGAPHGRDHTPAASRRSTSQARRTSSSVVLIWPTASRST